MFGGLLALPFMAVGGLLVFALPLLVVLFLTSLIFSPRSHRVYSNDAVQILNRRLVNGEISQDEYIRMKSMIS